MKGRRFRAPSSSGGMLAEPSLDQCEALAWSNRARLESWNHDFQGRRSSALRSIARAELLGASRSYMQSGCEPVGPPVVGAALERPLVLSGHQPELYHPGVWVKNFVGGSLAQALGGVSAHIVVDNDLPKAADIRVPTFRGQALHTVRVEFDRSAPEVPFECWRLAHRPTFASFPDRVRQTLGGLEADPLLDQFWPVASRSIDAGQPVGLAFAAARRSIERDWGLANHDVPLSRLCQTEAFLWFFAHLVAHLDRFRAIHNAALEAYRHANRIRSRNHPVPPLREQGEWREAPFWVWRNGAPARRRSLMVAANGQELLLRISGEPNEFLRLPLGPERDACCAVERLRELPALGIALRTRALTTTLFSRLVLSDLFIHGIGGAKYDELGDTILAQFFELEPPGFLTLSLTMWLGLPQRAAGADELRRLHQTIRDLVFNPDRHLGENPAEETARLIALKHAVIAGPVATHAQRADRCRALRECNALLAPAVAGPLRTLREQAATLERELHENRWARYR